MHRTDLVADAVTTGGDRHPLMRVFLGVALGAQTRTALAALIAARTAEMPKLRWTRAGNLHITMHFFGELDDAGLQRAAAATAPVAAASQPFTQLLDHCGCFPARGPARILWVGGDGQRLAALAGHCHSALCAAGFTVDERPFNAHCTTARVPDRRADAVREAWLQPIDPLPAFTVDEIVYFESRSGADGVRYLPLLRQQLSALPGGGQGS